MRIADYIQDSIVDGPGLRFAVFTQGCIHHCEGCHNPETHDPMGGREISVQELIDKMLASPLTSGLTLSGGDPFLQPEPCAELARAAKEHGKNVWAYSGWTFEELLADERPGVRQLLENTDVLVDGRFVLSLRSLEIPFRGSTNQRLVDVPKSLKEGRAVLWEHNG